MHLSHGRAVFLLLFCGALAAHAQDLTDDPAVIAPPPVLRLMEEQLVYDVSWMGATAGRITITLHGPAPEEPPDSMHAVLVAETAPFFSRFFTVDDRFDSSFTTGKFQSLVYRKKVREGKYRRLEKITFNAETGIFQRRTGKITFQKTMEGPFQPGVLDPIASFYFIRSQTLKTGESIRFPAHADGKNYQIQADIMEFRQIKTPLGVWNAWRITPQSTFEGRVFRPGESKMSMYIANHERRLPVLLEADVSIGTLKATLIKVSYGNEITGIPGPAEDPADPAAKNAT